MNGHIIDPRPMFRFLSPRRKPAPAARSKAVSASSAARRAIRRRGGRTSPPASNRQPVRYPS